MVPRISVDVASLRREALTLRRGVRNPNVHLLAIAVVLVTLFQKLTPGFLAGASRNTAQARGEVVTRKFFGDLFSGSKPQQDEGVDQAEYQDDEPGRGGPYAPEGFDRQSMRYEIVRYPHPALRHENRPITVFDKRLRRLAANLFRTMYAAGDGIGLAAPQVGINLQVMVYNENPSNRNEEVVFVNPRIIESSQEATIQSESCLSFPRISGNIHRAAWVVVEAADWDGNLFQRRIEGFEARLFQHEFDHLTGVVMIDRFGEQSLQKVQGDINWFIKDFSESSQLEPAI